MSLEIKITVPDDAVATGKADRYVSTALGAIGYSRSMAHVTQLRIEASDEWKQDVGKPGVIWPVGSTEPVPFETMQTGIAPEQDVGNETSDPAPSTGTTAQLRLHGKAGEGRTRRTKIEMAEDEAIEAAMRAAGRDLAEVDELLTAGHTREAILAKLSVLTTVDTSSADETQQISTGENRSGPDDPSEADAQQDAADEAAEAAAGRDPNAGPNHADLTAAVGRYQKKYGMEAAIADTPVILRRNIPDVPVDDLPAAIEAIEAAIRDGRPGAAAPASASAQPATKAQVGDALMAYARKFDGPGFDPTDVSTYPNMHDDGRKVFSMLFGAGVEKLGQIPDKGDGVAYGQALAGILEMTEKNPFKREAK